MIYGLTGNVTKDEIWQPLAEFADWLDAASIPFVLDQPIADGLVERALMEAAQGEQYTRPNFYQDADAVLSFGGDGTLLTTAYNIGARETPVMGVNLGRLGFLADTEVQQLRETVQLLERGQYRIESRMVLEARYEGPAGTETRWGLNDFVIERSLTPQLISVDGKVDSAPLTTYWADGLIIATPTGSTAYSLSVGGPILVPGSGVMVLTPLAPHTLTVRPIVIPAESVVSVCVTDRPFVLASDGRSTTFSEPGCTLTVRKANHAVKLIKLPTQDYFQTLRSKLGWGGR